MTEDEARRVVLLQAVETAEGSGAPDGAWRDDDRAWATRQAVAIVGDGATPERFVAARAAVAMPRLAERDRRAARWLARRGWHGAWVAVAIAIGFGAGLAADQLGEPQRVNLLAPAVWVVVAWNLAVYAALLLPLPSTGLRRWVAGWGQGTGDGPARLWWRHAAPLAGARAALVLHAAAAALALGLCSGMYLRGLVFDYRAGWQSTFLDAAQVQALLGALLAPASALTGIALPDVAALRVGPDGIARASAAPWIHLYGATLALAAIAPRALLAAFAALRARALARRFPLPLDTPYFESLHPLMRPGLSRAVRLLWLAPAGVEARLFGIAVSAPGGPLTLLASDEGDELQLLPPRTELAAPSPAPAGWRRWFAVSEGPDAGVARLRASCDAVLLVAGRDDARPGWLAEIDRPLVVLDPGADAAPPALPLRALADGWLAEGRLVAALDAALDADPRWHRLAASWRRREAARLEAVAGELAESLARIATTRVPLADSGWRVWRSDAEADAARAALAATLEAELVASGERLHALLGRAPAAIGTPASGLRQLGVGEKRAALAGSVVSGALLGLKADLLSGGLTMGGGALVGAVLGALGGAGIARGLNVVRDGGPPSVTWDRQALVATTEAMLLRVLIGGWGVDEVDARARVSAALAAAPAVLEPAWTRRPAGGAAALAQTLRAPMSALLRRALGGPG